MVHLELPDNWQDLAAGYVLNNLSEEEAWIWDMLLQEYPELHQETQRLEGAFNGLADAVPLQQPSANLLQKIHATIDAEQSASQSSPKSLPHPTAELKMMERQSSTTIDAPSNPSTRRNSSQRSMFRRFSRRPMQSLSRQPLPRQSWSSERSRLKRRTVQFGAVIATGIIATLGFQVQRLQTQLQQASTELEQTSLKITSLNRQLRQAESLTQSTRPVVQTLQEPGKLIYSLAGSNLANTASGSLVMSEEQQVMIVVQNLPPLPEGQVYRLWAALQTKDVVYCGQFNTNAQGIIQLTPSSDHCGEDPSQMIITLDAVTDPTTQGGPVVMQSSI